MFWWDFRVCLYLSHGSRRGHISRAPVRCHGERWMKQRRPRHSCSSLFSLSPRAHKAHFKAWKAHAGHRRAAGPVRGEWQTLPPAQPQPFVNMHPHALPWTHFLHSLEMHFLSFQLKHLKDTAMSPKNIILPWYFFFWVYKLPNAPEFWWNAQSGRVNWVVILRFRSFDTVVHGQAENTLA